jgi:hypothetical protein
MKRTNARRIGEMLQLFLDENPQLWQKILEVRIERAWGEVLGVTVMKSTRNLYVRNRILYVSINSSVLRNELLMNRERLVNSLNKHAGAEVIRDVIIR